MAVSFFIIRKFSLIIMIPEKRKTSTPVRKCQMQGYHILLLVKHEYPSQAINLLGIA